MLFRNLFFALVLAVGFAAAGDLERHQERGGVSIYLGVIPSQLIREHENMHGGPEGKQSYHILVALFDTKSTKRITDAKVSATVASVGMRGEKKSLQPMRNELLSYGNYFILDRPGRYSIKIEIYRKKSEKPVTAEFVYTRPED